MEGILEAQVNVQQEQLQLNVKDQRMQKAQKSLDYKHTLLD